MKNSARNDAFHTKDVRDLSKHGRDRGTNDRAWRKLILRWIEHYVSSSGNMTPPIRELFVIFRKIVLVEGQMIELRENWFLGRSNIIYRPAEKWKTVGEMTPPIRKMFVILRNMVVIKGQTIELRENWSLGRSNSTYRTAEKRETAGEMTPPIRKIFVIVHNRDLI